MIGFSMAKGTGRERKRVGAWPVPGHTTNLVSLNYQGPGVLGTLTANLIDTTTMFGRLIRNHYVSAAGAGSIAGVSRTNQSGQLQFWRGDAQGHGGFVAKLKFGWVDAVLVATANMFVGMREGTSVPVDVVPSTLANVLGIGCNSGDTTLQLYAAGAVAQARINLGADFPVNTNGVEVYELTLTARPGSSVVLYTVHRMNTGHKTSGSLTGAQLPTLTTLMGPQFWRSNGITAAAVGIDVMGAAFETWEGSR